MGYRQSRTVLAFVAVFALISGCDALLGIKPAYLNDQAMDIFHDVMSQSYDLAPSSYSLTDQSKTYLGEETTTTGLGGSARLYGSFRYTYDELYVDSNTTKKIRTWTYEDFELRYQNYQRDRYCVAIESGSMVISGTRREETRTISSYTGSSSSTTKSGSIRVSGTVTVSGVSVGKEVRDTVTIDVKREPLVDAWFYNGTIANGHEEWAVYME